MSISHGGGRLCNQIIRNLALSIIAEKHNLCVVKYSAITELDNLGIRVFSGGNTHINTNTVSDHNYFDIFNKNTIYYNLYANDYFQTKEISVLIHKYLNTISNNIIVKNHFNSRYNTNNDIFIHVRLSDVEQYNPGIIYYINAIKAVKQYNNIFLATDDPKHSIINSIVQKYPSTQIIHYDEINTLMYGSTCKHVILSHGSFSAVIGYLSFFSDVYYPEYNFLWYGDMFSIDGWNRVCYL